MAFELLSLQAALLITAVITAVGVLAILKLLKDKTKRISTLRLFVQIIAVFVVFMGLLIGPFGERSWLPLGIAPRDHLTNTDLFGVSMPDGLSVPILSCYYASGRTVTCPIWQLQTYIFPLWGTDQATALTT
jgi:hypothetical protein